ncbi:MAG: DNA mismatch repair protein MutS [Acidobacteriota bacterium]|nr:DNA mismatch repair protein MutS [Acidobacteriota bacterium]
MTAYQTRARAHVLCRDEELQRSRRISRLRLAVFLAALSLLTWTLMSGADPLRLAVAAGLFAAFGALVVWHARVEERAAWHDALRLACEYAQARVDRHWAALPSADAPSGIDLANHPYALDLDLFGRASLFQWLGPAATPGGSRRLAEWLLAAASPDAIQHRQAAVAELAGHEEWREQLAAHGVLARGTRQQEIDAFLAWAEGPGPLGPHAALLKTATVALLGSMWLLIAAGASAAWWMIPVLLGVVLSFAMTKRIQQALEQAGAGQHALGRYAALFEHVAQSTGRAALLQGVRERLSADGVAAAACMRRLNRIRGFGEFRTSAALLHFPVQAMTLWDFHVLFALDRWRRAAGGRVRDWMAAIADVDALAALAGARSENPAWANPAIGQTRVLAARALGHPLIPDSRRVVNDVEVGPPGTLLLVTGSNMSGKSTLLRSIGLNAVLAQAGAPVCASELRMPAVDLQTSIRIQDSLELGLSYFMAALARLKGVVDAAERPREGRVLLYLLDEILQGTNSAERGIAVQGVARHLLSAEAIGVMTTHDLNLAGEEPLKSSARLVHFTELVDENDAMRFDYRLREGLATSRNALRLMKMIGIDLVRS